MKRLIMCTMFLVGIIGLGGCTTGTTPTTPQLSLGASEVTMEAGGLLVLTVASQDLTGEITAGCDNEEILSVELQGDQVEVTAHAVGEAVVYVESVADNVRAECTVTVRESPFFVYLPEGRLVLRSNRTATVRLTSQAELTEEVVWPSSDPSIATVEWQGLIGRVTSVARGECTITVSCGNSSCTFTVIVGV